MGAGAGSRSTFVDGDVRVTSAHLTGFVVNELEFPAGYTMELDPEEGYVAVVLEGRVREDIRQRLALSRHGERLLDAGGRVTRRTGSWTST